MAAGRRKSAKTGSGTQDKRLATTMPVADQSELRGYWNRAFSETGYHELVVRVTTRTDNVISFQILAEEQVITRGGDDFTINLDDGNEVWSSLPSTAQDIDPEASQRVGYLFVTEQWLERQRRGGAKVLGGPGKWPAKTSL
jgi:hypothetical protein